MNIRYTKTEKPVNWQSANYRVITKQAEWLHWLNCNERQKYLVILDLCIVFESNSIDYCFGYIGRQFPKF